MQHLVASLILFSSFVLSGCISWPPGGQGGMAEHQMEPLSPVLPDQPLGPEHGLRFEFELVKLQLDTLVLEGAELCFPATVVQARQRQNRIIRELQGGLDYDAANDLIIQRRLLNRLERQLDYVQQQASCRIPVNSEEERPGDIGSRIHDLLNSDNQFAFDSAELNPKYIGRLAEAAQLLRNKPDYHLRITGHADAVGTKDYNQTLALARAKQVGRYLQILGLPSDRIEVDAVGADSPLFEGMAPHYRLVNRRVSIELVETSTITKLARE